MRIPQTPEATPRQNGSLLWYSFPALDKYKDRLVHGFSTRLGGVSEGIYSSMNLSFSRGDNRDSVYRNFCLFGEAVGFPADTSVLSAQTHGTTVQQVDASYAGRGIRQLQPLTEIDGLMTDQLDLPLITSYADCTPLFFYAPDKHMIANCHAGWRGTAKRMAAAGVKALAERGCDPAQLVVVIGPSASPRRYEVGEDTAAHFANIHDEQGAVVKKSAAAGKYMLDMWRANRAVLKECGVEDSNIHTAGLCTIEHPDIFFSHRVLGNQRGSLAAVMMLK